MRYGVPVAARTQMRSHTLALVENLDRGRRRAHFHQFLHQVVRHAVVVGVENDVVVDVDPGADHWLRSNRSAGRGFSAGLSRAANCDAREPSRLRNGRWLMRSQQLADRLVQFRRSRRTSGGAAPR